jgi:hypothetical protein
MGLELRYPRGWTATTRAGCAPTAGRTSCSGRVPTGDDVLGVTLEPPAARFWPAGVLLGVGGHVDDATGTVVRAGGELFFTDSWLASLVVELDLDDETGLTAVALVGAATPWILVIPSLELGLGLPVRVRPEVEVGARVEADAHLGPLGLVVAFDWFPGLAAGPDRFQATMLFQVGL